MNISKRAALVVFLSAFVLGGCSLTGSATPTASSTPKGTASESPTVVIKNSQFSPATLTVKSGQQVTITNQDLVGHSYTSDGQFDSGVISNGQSATITAPTKPGTYAVHCIPHPSIKGTLVVQ